MQRKLSELSNEQLLSLNKKISGRLIESAHGRAKKAVGHGVFAHTVEGDQTLAERLSQVREEFERRASRGELSTFAGKVLARDFHRLEKAERAAGKFAERHDTAGAPNVGKQHMQLTSRERRICTVIRQGARGLQYCRELDRAGVKPRRSGTWRACPGTYPAAYQAGEPWRHRIQDEKSKVRRRAELAKN